MHLFGFVIRIYHDARLSEGHIPFCTIITAPKTVECAFRLTFPFFLKDLPLNTHNRSITTNIHVKRIEVLLKLVLHITGEFITHRPWSCSLRHRNQEWRFLRLKVHIIVRV